MRLLLIFFIFAAISIYFAQRYQPTKPADNFEVKVYKEPGQYSIAQIFRNGKPCGCKNILTVNKEMMALSCKATGPSSAVVSYDNGKTSELIISGDTITVIDYDKFGKPDYTGEANK